MQDQNDKIQFDSSEEGEYHVSNDKEEKRKIYANPSDQEIGSLKRKYEEGELIIDPDFQRHYVWDKVQASRLIESALLGIPLPIVYMFKEPDGTVSVIDGQQRLTSFFSFINEAFPLDKSDFKLTGLRELKSLNGKKYGKLLPEQKKEILNFAIRTVTFDDQTDAKLKFEIFERLNTGAVSLNAQELRNCIYRGPYNQLLIELSNDPVFRKLFGIAKPERRMKDVELVLRFAAFYHTRYTDYKPSIKTFLNLEMGRWRYISDCDAAELRDAFKNSVTIIKSLLGNHAFKRFHEGTEANADGHWERKQFNTSLYDILMYSFAKADKNKVQRNLDEIRDAFINLLTSDKEFMNSIELSTSSRQAVITRFDKWMNTLGQIIDNQPKEDRCFSFDLKKEFFDRNPICEICNQTILSIDDAAMDHIQQYGQGGKTTPENARLTHRYCNLARSRTE